MSFPDCHFDQDNLPLLCQDWPLDESEYHPQNSLYGFSYLLKRHAGLPKEEPLPWAMEHAIHFDAAEPYVSEAASAMPVILAVTESRAEVLRRFHQGRCRSEAIGSAYFYMEKEFRDRYPELTAPPPSERRGTLVFPVKSTEGIDRDYDREAFAAALAALPEEYQPVVVSIFWKDYQRGVHRAFVEAGLPVVTSGSPYDPQFLFRQHDLCRQFKYACANDLSTSFCLSVLAGCHFFYWPTGPLRVEVGGVRRDLEGDPSPSLPGKRACIEASPFPPGENRAEQLALAERFAGKSCVRDPLFFRRLSEEGRLLVREYRPLSVSLESDAAVSHLFRWQPRGIDTDGWAQSRAGLIVPSNPEAAGVRLRFQVPPRPEPDWGSLWSVTLDGRETFYIPVNGGEFDLEIPAGEDRKPRTILILASDEVQVGNEGRRRCFRLRDIDWIDQLNEPVLGWALRNDPDGFLGPLHPPAPIEFEGEPIAFARRSRWMLENVTETGWVKRRCAFSIPANSSGGGVRVKLRMRENEDPAWKGRLSVSIDQAAPEETEVGLGNWYLEIPGRRDGRSRRVEIRVAHPVVSPEIGDGQPLSDFRLKEIRWIEDPAGARGDGPVSARLVRQEELKGRTARSGEPRRSLWKRIIGFPGRLRPETRDRSPGTSGTPGA